MKRGNRNRIIAGIFAVLFVLNGAVGSMAAFADEVKAPSLSEVTAQTAESGFSDAVTITAGDTEGSIFTIDNSFTDAITMFNSPNVPDSITTGQDIQVYGRIESGTSALNSVIVAVYPENNTSTPISNCTKIVYPNSNAYDISAVDNDIAFNTLTAGNYYFVVMASNASYKNVALHVKKFTVVGSSFGTDSLGISSQTNIPASITAGTSLSVTGIVSSSISPLTHVVVAVYDSNNKPCTGGQANLNGQTYDISRLSQYVQFNTLAAGSYTYRVTATNSSQTDFTVQEQRFTVTSNTGSVTPIFQTDSLTGSVTEVPSVLTQGSQFTISGSIVSSYSELTYVSAAVYDTMGNPKIGYAVAPRTTTYNLNSLSPYLNFATLGAGTYRYVVIASNSANSNVTLKDQTFTVQANSTYTNGDVMNVSGITQIPANIRVGQPVSVRGTVTSTYTNLTKVAVEVYDTLGNFKTGKTVSINSKSYNLSGLDSFVYFDRLTDGTYEFRVTCSNGSNTNSVVYTKKFAVGTGVLPGSVDSSADKLYLSNVFNMPASIRKGQAVSVTGMVSSASTNLTSVGVNVYNSANQKVTGLTVDPKSKTFDLKNLDRSVCFNQLPDGVYTLVIHASNGTRTNEILLQQQFSVGTATVSNNDTMYMSGYVALPAQIQAGQGVDVVGVVTSPVSNLTLVDVGIYNAAGQRMFGQMVYPNAKTYNLALQDNLLRFDQLTANQEYTFKVTASNGAANNVVLVSQKFTVGNSNLVPVSNSDALTVTNVPNIPDTIAAGTAISVTGTVYSAQSNIYSLYCGIFNSSGQPVTGRTVNPNSRTYDLRALDSSIQFNTLASGQTYTFAVVASNASNTNYTVYSKKFTVGYNSQQPTTGDTMTLSGETQIPASIALRQAVTVNGYITSAYSNITNVTVGVYNNTATQRLTGATATPNSRTFNLHTLDSQVQFNALPQGSYVYIVQATNASGTFTLQNKSFTVGYGSSQTPASGTDMYVSGVTTVPSNISQGQAISVRGTVISSSSNITTLTCGVWDVNTTKWMTGASNVPVNAKSFDLSRVDAQVHFNSLPVGNYVFGVIATNGTKSNETLVSQKFTVGGGSGSGGTVVAGDGISFNNTMSLGNSISRGQAVSVRGTITSASSNLNNVTVGIYNSSNVGIYVQSVNPYSKSYNISALDSPCSSTT